MYAPKLREVIHAILATSSFPRTLEFNNVIESIFSRRNYIRLEFQIGYIFMNDADCRGALVNMSVCFHFHYILRRL